MKKNQVDELTASRIRLMFARDKYSDIVNIDNSTEDDITYGSRVAIASIELIKKLEDHIQIMEKIINLKK